MREGAALLNQLMLTVVVAVLVVLALVWPFDGNRRLFLIAAAVVFATTVVVAAVSWRRLVSPWLALAPVVDIVAIGAMRLSGTSSGFGVLWMFPTMWLAADFAVIGIIGVVCGSVVLFAVDIVRDPQHAIGYTAFMLPLAILGVGIITHVTVRRAREQRALLDTQARVLGRALERTRRQEQEVTEVLDAVDFGVVRVERDGTPAVTNRAHQDLQRTLDDDREHAFAADGTTPLAQQDLPLARVLRGEVFDHELVWFGASDGPRRALSVTARRLTATTGEDAGAIVVSSDLTAEMTALRARDELVASVSHELRTPLTSILGYLDLVLEDATVPAPARENVRVAERNAERLLGIIGDILTASQRTHDAHLRMDLAVEIVDVADIVRGAVESLAPRAEQRGIVVDISRVQPVRARVDPQRLRQVLDNLIANAIAYNVEAGAVEISTARVDDDIRVAVRDTGIGLAPEDIPQLFHRFYRGRAARDAHVPGTGLGLPISRDIVRAHGGDILVDGDTAGSTTFTVRLPAVTEP